MKRILGLFIAALMLLSFPCAMNAGASDGRPSRFYATFLQNWLCRDWTEDQWREEFDAAREAGFQAVILQSVCDIVRGEASGEPQDPAGYPDASAFCMYPSAIPALSGAYRSSQNGGDALALALTAAQETGMQLWIGTVSDDLWWKYGWGMPQPDGDSTYFEEWSAENAALSASLVTEIWERYGREFGGQIGGFYYVNEIWNLDAACHGTDGGLYSECIGGNIRQTIRAIDNACPDKPLLISPFYNPDLSTPAQYTAFLTDLIEAAQFRPIDIYAGQDGGGAERSPAVIREWALAQKQAAEGQMRFWINCESFQADLTPKPIEALRADYAATADLAECAILFSWEHYYRGTELDAAFTAFAGECLWGDVNGDGVLSVTDAVMLQKWLLCIGKMTQPEAADLLPDGKIDILDLALVKHALLHP
ncbi:MAG: DUF4434 domain-containing protein [Oscillospiraceae bacterium]|nr:DUF4434 domain-containing protein [Oscillospiraceae bacterium]